ncbi:MAG: hypothetical protein ACRDPC_27515 [Solirubrobacteraceae bacterium]
MLDQLSVAALTVFAQIPDPGQGKKPPGSDKFLTILQWGAWIAFGICVLGVIVAGAQMALSHRHGSQGGEHAARLGWVAAGCVVVGSASALVGALV